MISAKPSLSVLVVNDHAEEVKVISTTLRGFFPDCRVEAVYTSEDALQWSLRDDWHLVLVDDAISPRSGVDILHELKRNRPHAAIILQTDRSDSTTALQALQQGADFLLFKHSPAFVTELLFYTQEAVEKRALELRLEQTFQRHLRLVETLSDMVYELDQEGRFIYVSPTVTSLLGYAPEDLAGQHFSMLLPPTQEPIARYRMNERRTGTRSARQLELYVLGKRAGESEQKVTLMQLTAKGLYDERHRYLGTVGLLRDLSVQREQTNRLQELERRLQEADRQLAASRDVALSSHHLQQPLSALLQDSQRLLTTLQGLQIEQHLKQLASHATQATETGHEVWKSMQFMGRDTDSIALNSILREVVAGLSREQVLIPETVEQRFGRTVPAVVGNPQELKELFRILFLYALQTLADKPAAGRLVLETFALKIFTTASASSPGLPSVPSTPYVVIAIRVERGAASLAIEPSPAPVSGSDFLRAHEIIRRHGGSIEIGSPLTPPFHIMVRLPAIPASVQGQHKSPSEPQPTPSHNPLLETMPAKPAGPPDRRRSERIRLYLPLDLSIGTTRWRGTILNIGSGGMFLASPQPTPPIEHQPVYLILRTSVSFLELHGTVRYRAADSPPTETDYHYFIIEFAPLTESEVAVFHSSILELQEPSTAVTIEGLIPETTGPVREIPSTLSLQPERRWYVRTAWADSARLALCTGSRPESQSGILVNIGKGGACIQTTGRPSIQGFQSQQIWLTVEAVPQDLRGQVIWAAQRADSDDAWYIGVNFHRLSPEAEESLNHALASRFSTPSQLGREVNGEKSGSALLFLRNRHGASLALSLDRLSDSIRDDSPVLIICPGYAQTRVDYLALAYAFAANGYRILRYDPTHALGLSHGHPQSMTLGGIKDDLETVVECARGQWPGAPLAVLASDLSARVALKLFGRHRTADMLLLLDPVLDLKTLLHDLHGRDLVEEHETGRQFGLANLMGLQIDADRFLHDAVTGGYVDFASVADDIRLLECRVLCLQTPPGERTFAHPGSIESALMGQAIDLLGARGAAVSLSSAITENEAVASERYRESWHSLLTQCRDLVSADKFHGANPQEVSAQYRHEVEQLRTKAHAARLERSSLWVRFTQYSGILSEIPSYFQHCNDLYQFIHLFKPHHDVLDVGCSHYGFARLWWLNRLYSASSNPLPDKSGPVYAGIDIRLGAVKSAREAFTTVRRQTSAVFPGVPTTRLPASAQWIVGDAASLPFGNERFDCIVCQFVLNFSDNPVVTLRELYRLLRPGGTLIVSLLTLSTDFASIYRAFLDETQQDGLSGVHRDILLALAQLQESIRCRRLHSFTRQSVAALCAQLNLQPARIFPSLNDHVLIATVQKPDSAR